METDRSNGPFLDRTGPSLDGRTAAENGLRYLRVDDDSTPPIDSPGTPTGLTAAQHFEILAARQAAGEALPPAARSQQQPAVSLLLTMHNARILPHWK